MHIDGWSIDAFGALQDVERRGLGEGLTVIHGPNEAGKSTLRHFVLGVLFGFSAGNSKNPLYAPSTGTARSGRLFIESDGEEFVLSRLEKRGSRAGNLTLLGPDGTARSDAELAALLGGLTRSVYDKVFAVGLDELNDLQALTDGDLQDHLLSAGVTGAGRVATQARNQLRTRADAIHRSRAQSTEVAAIRESLRAVEDRLRSAQQAAGELAERRESLGAKRQRAGELAEREHAATGRAQRAERLIELWPHYLEATEAAAALTALGAEGAPLPPDAAESLATRIAAVDAATADVELRQGDLDQMLSQLEVLESGHLPDLAVLQPDIAALQHRLSGWAQQEEEVIRRSEELSELRRRFDFELDVIGVERASDLARVGAAVAARDHLRVTRSAFDEKAAARQRAAEDLEQYQKEIMEAESAVSTGTTLLTEQSVDLDSGSVRIEAERAAREALLLGELSSELTELDQRRRDLAVAEGKIRSLDDEPGGARSVFEPHRVLVAVAVLLAMGGVVVGIMTGPFAGVALGVTAAVVGACAFGLRNVGTGRLDEDSRQGLVAVSNALERRCTDRARMLGFADLPSLDEVAEQKAVRDHQATELAALVTSQQRLDTARATARAKKQRLAELGQAHEAALGAWQEWLELHHLPTALRPEGVDEWLSHLDQARVLDDQIRQAERREHELQAALEQAPKSVIELTERAERASRPMAGDDGRPQRVLPVTITPPSVDSSIGELQAVVAAIAEVVAEAAAADREVSRVKDQTEVQRAELARATKTRKSASAELTAYLASAGVVNEAQLRRRLADQEQRASLVTKVSAFDRRVETASGSQAEDDRAALRAPQPRCLGVRPGRGADRGRRGRSGPRRGAARARRRRERSRSDRELGRPAGARAGARRARRAVAATAPVVDRAARRRGPDRAHPRPLSRRTAAGRAAAGRVPPRHDHRGSLHHDPPRPRRVRLDAQAHGRRRQGAEPRATGSEPRHRRAGLPLPPPGPRRAAPAVVAPPARRHPRELRPDPRRDLDAGARRGGEVTAGHRVHLPPLGGRGHAGCRAGHGPGRPRRTRRLIDHQNTLRTNAGPRPLVRALLLSLLVALLGWAGEGVTAPVSGAAEPRLGAPTATATITFDVASGRVLQADNARTRLRVASTFKVLTALVVRANVPVDDDVPISARAEAVPPLKLTMQPGTRWNADALLHAMLIASLNDAAVALAERAGGGSLHGFDAAVSAEARRLGLADAPVLHDPAGLDDDSSVDGGNLISARDLAIATRAFLADPLLASIVRLPVYHFAGGDGRPHVVYNHNAFLQTYDGAVGVKTGYTAKSGHSLIAAATRGGRTLAVVVVGSGDPVGVASARLDAAFATAPGANGTGDVLPRVGVAPVGLAGTTTLGHTAHFTASLPVHRTSLWRTVALVLLLALGAVAISVTVRSRDRGPADATGRRADVGPTRDGRARSG